MTAKNKLCINFGEHLTLDGYGGDPKRLNDKNLVLKFLSELPKKINSRTLGGPELYKAKEGHTKDPGGWSGFVVIAESHISVHTFPKRRFVSADVYTCVPGLKTKLIDAYFRKIFELKDVESHLIKRGTKYPAVDLC